MRNIRRYKPTSFMNKGIKIVNKQIQQSIENSTELSSRFYLIYARRFY